MAGATRGFRRTALAALLTAGGVAVALGPGSPATAQQPAAPAADSGKARASAEVLSLAPTTGALALALTSGTALAETAGGLAQSMARSAGLGLIGSALTAEGCDGRDGALSPDQLPQPTQVDNRAGDASAATTELPLGGSTFGAGAEEVSATVQPAGRASVTAVAVDLAPLARIGGGRATAEAEVFPGAGREARATVEVDLELGGTVRLTGMRWTARHRTGAEPGADGSFTIEALELLGVPLPVDDIEGAIESVNAALAETGFRIDLPRVERIQEEGVDLVRVTPLRLMIADSPLGAAGVRPALDVTRDARLALAEAIGATACQANSLLLVGEIGVGVASGTGDLVLSIGGVEAQSADVVIEDVFGNAPPAGPVEAAAPPAGEASSPPAAGAEPPAPAAAGAPEAAAPVPIASSPLSGERACETTHPFGWPSCSHGAAGAVGLVGAAATAGTAALDLRRRKAAALLVEAVP